MPTQYWETLLNAPAPTASGTALASSTTLTDVSPAPQFTMPANALGGMVTTVRLTASGFFSTTGTPTLLLGFYYGAVAGTALAATGAVTTATATNFPWRMEYTGNIRTVGSTGTIMGSGVLYLGTSLTAYSVIPIPATAIATVTIDTTAAKAITVGAQWGTSSASNTLTLTQFLIESVA